MNKHKKEQGQILVLIVLAIVGIFGFAALAVDMGRVYAERRRAQNAADAAAYAAAFAKTQNQDAIVAGISSTKLNGFDDNDPTINPGGNVDVQIHNPPISGRFSVATQTIKPDEYFQVIIRTRIDPVFAQFVYGGILESTVEAVAKGVGSKAFSDGNAIVATCTTCCDALKLTGNSFATITGGNLVSNSLATDKTNNCYSGNYTGSACFTMVDGSFINAGGFNNDGKCGITYEENSSNLWSGTPPVTPTCPGTPPNSCGTGYTKCPGTYKTGITISGNNTVERLAPGMYCLEGDLDVKSGDMIGDEVMIVMNNNSSVKLNTNGSVVLSAPSSLPIPDPAGGPDFEWSGFLIYMVNSNGTITINGGATLNLTGTIYAPDPPKNGTKCVINGSAGSSITGSIICYDVDLSGSNGLSIIYKEEVNAQKRPSVELSK
jgi:hypothetical protein